MNLVRRIFIQITDMVFAVQQELMLMLAMDIEQLCGNLPKRLKRYDRAVDPADVDKTMEAIRQAGDAPYVVGKIIDGEKGVDLC